MKLITFPFRLSRRLYDWVLSFADSRNSRTALFFLAMAEASFFPLPPDALLIALCMGAHKRWFSFALICSVGSVIGGLIGYWIGYAAFDLIGESILALIATIGGQSPSELLQTAQFWFTEKEIWGQKVGGWAVGIAGFTPIPYKVFTIAAGFFKMNLAVFLIASVISRSLRFFAVAGLVGALYKKYGSGINDFIDKYFNALSALFVILLIAGFLILKLI